MINNSYEVEVDGNSYIVKIHSTKEDENVGYKFSTELDGKNYQLSAKVSNQLTSNLKQIIGLNVGEELNKILEEEVKLEISRYYDGPYWNEHNKLEKKGTKE